MVTTAPPTRSDSLVVAEPVAFSLHEARARPSGRIGGVWGDAAAANRLRAALGPGGRLVCHAADGAGPRFVADSDCATLDGRPLTELSPPELGRLGERLASIEGAFAIAWWDDGALWLARDAIGERSIFFIEGTEGLAFASALRPLVDAGLAERDLDLRALAAYLTYAYVPGHQTMLARVRELAPGECLRFTRGRLERRRFWHLPPQPAADSEEPEAELTRALRAGLERAVTRRLPDSGPGAALLSGGLDSSLVVALAARLGGAPPTCYSISFGKEHRNELEWSRAVAHHCGAEHRVVELRPDVVAATLDDTMGALNDPIGDPLTVPNAMLFQEVARESRFALNGEGGDPCFGGPKNLPMLLSQLFGDGGRDEAAEATYLRAHHKCYDDLRRMLEPAPLAALESAPLESDVSPFLSDPRWPGFVTQLMALNVSFKGPHHILQKVDCQSFPFGVLPRSPLFDRDVVELAFRIPARLKLRGSTEKYLLKRAVADLLPTDVLERPKSGMLVPIEGWFRGPLADYARQRLLDGLAPRRLIRAGYLEDLLAGRLGGLRPRYGAKIWLLVALEAWLSSVVDQAPPA